MAVKSIRELRYLSGATFNTSFTAANDVSWNAGTATKLRPISYDDTGLEYAALPDATLQTQLYGRPAPIATLRTGSLSFGTYMGAAESDNSANPIATLASKVLGGIAVPSANRGDLAEASCTTTQIEATAHEAIAGTAVLINGEARRVASKNTDDLTVSMAFESAPSENDVITLSTTAYLDPDVAMQYLDFLTIGHDVDTTNDCRNVIGCQCQTMALRGGNPGELPGFDWTFMAADWRWEPSGTLPDLAPASAPQGNDPPTDRGVWGMFIQDNGTSTRTVFKGGNLAIANLSPMHHVQTSANGVNGIGGYERGPLPDGFAVTFDLLLDQDHPGIYDDFVAGTAKQALFQFGSTAQGCCAIDIPKCYVAADPKPSELNGLSAISVTLVAEVAATSGDDIVTSPIAIHWF